MGIWHAGNVVSNIFSGLLAAAILTNMDNTFGLRAWQWFFLIEGVVTIAFGILLWFIFPDCESWLAGDKADLISSRASQMVDP